VRYRGEAVTDAHPEPDGGGARKRRTAAEHIAVGIANGSRRELHEFRPGVPHRSAPGMATVRVSFL
jgi:hypothetical protein